MDSQFAEFDLTLESYFAVIRSRLYSMKELTKDVEKDCGDLITDSQHVELDHICGPITDGEKYMEDLANYVEKDEVFEKIDDNGDLHVQAFADSRKYKTSQLEDQYDELREQPCFSYVISDIYGEFDIAYAQERGKSLQVQNGCNKSEHVGFDGMERKHFYIQDVAVEPRRQVHHDDVNGKHIEVQVDADKPNGHVCPYDVKGIHFKVQDDADEPNGHEWFNDIVCKYFEIQVVTGERSRQVRHVDVNGKHTEVPDDEPNGHVCRYDVKGIHFKVQDDADGPNEHVCHYDVKGNYFNVHDDTDEPNDMGGRGFEMQDDADEPSGYARLNDVKGKIFELQEATAEPNGQVHLNYMRRMTFKVEEKYPESSVLEFIDDAKVNAFQIHVNTKPNFFLGLIVSTVGKICYEQILALTLGLLFSVGNSAFVEVPNNTVLQWKSRDFVKMGCKSDCQCNLRWFVNKNQGSEKEDLYNGYALNSDARSYCSITKNEPGSYNLELLNKPDAAQTYICFEPGTLSEVSADLIVLGDLIQSDNSTDDTLYLTCSIEFHGNWAPTIEWKENSNLGEAVLTAEVIVNNQRVTSTLVKEVQEGSRNYTCRVKFEMSRKPRHTSATNIPDGTQVFTFIKSEDERKTKSVNSFGTAIAISVFAVIVVALVIGIVCKCHAKRMKRNQQKRDLFRKATHSLQHVEICSTSIHFQLTQKSKEKKAQLC